MRAAALLIADQDVLTAYLRGGWPQVEDIQQSAERSLRLQKPFQPDYAIKAPLRDAGVFVPVANSYAGYSEILLAAFQSMSEGLWLRGRLVHVDRASFESWQRTLTLVMPLPVLSYFAATHWPNQDETKQVFNEWFASASCLPGPYLPELYTVAREKGLSEHHMHINGTTESDYVWQDALTRPKLYIANIMKGAQKHQVRQQLAQVNGNLAFEDLYRLLKLASKLRHVISELIVGKENFLTLNCLKNMVKLWPGTHHSHHPFEKLSGTKKHLINEALFCHSTFKHLSATNCQVTARSFHLYLLIQSLFHRLLSQQLTDKGFDQFERVTLNELRETTEQKYAQRFQQIQGMYHTQFDVLEGRFAPKDDAGKLNHLLQAIKSGYEISSLAGATKLRLTAHFIKEKDIPKPTYPCRHYPLRRRLEKQRKVLERYLARRPAMAELVNAIDAAGNELNAGPEVFAPIYRKLRASGWKHFTYHAGEDFQHLLGGMRQVFEAARFLDLRAGDRIGHATAVGIDPTLWLLRAAPSQQMSKGDGLDTLLFAHHQLLKLGTAEATASAYRLEIKIHELAEHIFKVYGLSVPTLQNMWLNRWRDPLDVSFAENASGLTNELLRAWHSSDVYERSREYCNVSTDLLSGELYRQLQDQMLLELNKQGIILEALPTSNIRISYYESYSEHHIHRWLSADSGVRPNVVFGTDDPGIFSTNLYNELAHVLISSGGALRVPSKSVVIETSPAVKHV